MRSKSISSAGVLNSSIAKGLASGIASGAAFPDSVFTITAIAAALVAPAPNNDRREIAEFMVIPLYPRTDTS